MPIPVLTAAEGAPWEAELVLAFERGELGIVVVRRCVDLADLLATASTGQARAVLLSAELRRLDRDALGRLASGGVAVVGLAAPGDEDAERRLRQLGVRHVLPADSAAAAVAAAVVLAVDDDVGPTAGERLAVADTRAALAPPAQSVPSESEAVPGGGQVVAVWGPTGAPGRTTVAVHLAAELAARDCSTLLVDADVYGGVVAQVLGLLDEAPGLAAAARLGNHGALDLTSLASLARTVSPTLRVLSGIARADHGIAYAQPHLIATLLLELARSLVTVTVVDCAFSLEQDEELAYDTTAPRRNGATLAVLSAADTVVAVGTADPVGLQRLVRALADLREAVPGVQPRVVLNRLRPGAVPGDAEREVRSALARYAGVTDVHVVPLDVAALDVCVAAGRTLVEGAPGSPARAAVSALAASLLGQPAPPARRGRRRLVVRR